MSGKNQFPIQFNWQSTNPATNFLPPPAIYSGGSKPSGVTSGTMSSTNTIYSQIIEVSRMDNIGLEFTWTGTPTGTFTLYGSNSGLNFYSLSIGIGAPAGSASGELVNLTQYPWKYLMLSYTNASGSGTLTAYGQLKDLN